MKWQELQEKVKNLTKRNIHAVELADALGIDKSGISIKKSRDKDVEEHEFKKIAQYFNLNFDELREEPEETYLMDYYPEVFGSCGNGVFELSQEKEQIRIPKKALFTQVSSVKKYSVINAYGSSMTPTLCDMDRLIVEHYDGEQIIDNRIYVFCYNSKIFIKRLVMNVNQLVIISDNTDYDTIKLSEKDLNKVQIIGQIVGLMRDMR